MADRELDFVSQLRLVWARRWVVVATAVCTGGLGLLYVLMVPATYHSEVTVTAAEKDGMLGSAGGGVSQLAGLASLAGVRLGTAGGAEREARAILESRNLAEQFVARNKVADELYRKEKSPPSEWRVVNRFRNSVLSIQDDVRKGTITIVVEWHDATVAAKWANDYVAMANEIIRRRTLDESARNFDYLNAQLAKTNVVEMQKVLYSLIENETKTLMLANARQEYAFRVVDPAVAAERPARPKFALTLLLSVAFGLVVGVAIAYLMELLSAQPARGP